MQSSTDYYSLDFCGESDFGTSHQHLGIINYRSYYFIFESTYKKFQKSRDKSSLY